MSAIGIGHVKNICTWKRIGIKKKISDNNFISAADIFYEENTSTELIIAAGEKVIVLLVSTSFC